MTETEKFRTGHLVARAWQIENLPLAMELWGDPTSRRSSIPAANSPKPKPEKSSALRPPPGMRKTGERVGFARDSALEEAGFEPSVSPDTTMSPLPISRNENTRRGREPASARTPGFTGVTESSIRLAPCRNAAPRRFRAAARRHRPIVSQTRHHHSKGR
jgi:hypothetical protein